MSDFGVFPYEVTSVYHHPNADRLDMVILNGGIRTVALRGRFPVGKNLGTRVWFIPENSLLPEKLLRFLGMWDDQKGKGKLSGSNGNRVKPMRLRGEMSDGILLSDEDLSLLGIDLGGVGCNGDIADALGITKWEPVIPQNMTGRSGNAGTEYTLNFDLNSIYKARTGDMFSEGEMVYVTEKMHGTACRIAFVGEDFANQFIRENTIYVPEFRCYVYAFSKGLGNKGIIFTKDDTTSVYQKMAMEFAENCDQIPAVFSYIKNQESKFFFCLGEICGPGIQDMTYGLKEPSFFIYGYREIANNDQSDQIWYPPARGLSYSENIKTVPIIGEYEWDIDINSKVLKEMAEADSSFGGIREGVVATAKHFPQKRFKLVSDRYLTRKGNTTDYN